MTESKGVFASDLDKVDARRNVQDDYDEVPELTADDFARAVLHENGVPIARSRGRPALEKPKRQVTLRLDDDLIERFRATGPGWQRRMNDTLRKAVGL